MKRSLIILISTAVAFVFGACNKHSWEEGTEGDISTKKVFAPHDHGHVDEHDEDHGDEHKQAHSKKEAQ